MMKKTISLFALALLTMSAWAANTYVKVTSIDQLEAGKKYIIVNEESSRAMGPITGGSGTNYGSYVNVTIDNSVIDIEGTDVAELTAHESGEYTHGPTWAFSLQDGVYILWTSGNSLNSISGTGTGGSGASGAKWVPTLTDNGVILKNNADITRILQYNAGAPRFACYASAQKPAVLYMQGEPEDEGITTLAQANALDDNEYFAFNGNAVVTVCKNGYLFLRDETGFGQIRVVPEGEFENGQVLNPGWEGVKTSNSGWNWFYNPAGLSASDETNAELAAPIVPNSIDESLLNAYVRIENQTPSFMPARSFVLPDGSRISKTESLWAGNADATTGNYNVTGVIVKVNGTLMINILDYENYVAPPDFIPGDVNGDGLVNISDVTMLVNLLMTEGEMPPAADFNGNGSTDISDVTALINYVMSIEN